MSPARHPKPYKQGKEQVTIPWKKRVLKRLETNKKNGVTPGTPEQLKVRVEAPKGSINKLLDLERDPQQLTSAYAEAITTALGIDAPVIETEEDDPNLARAVSLLRRLDSETLLDVLQTLQRLAPK